MKVKELIEKLQRLDPNATVNFECDDDWYCGEIHVVRQDADGNGNNCAILSIE